MFYNHETKAYIEATFIHGRFVDIETGRPITLEENTRVRITTPVGSILSKEEERKHKEIKKELLLKSGAVLEFHFRCGDKVCEFKVFLREDLFLTKKGNQHSKLGFSKCVIYKPNKESEKDFEADSFNQAFMKASIKYRPDNRSHTCNVFKTFYYKGQELEKIRPF